MSQRLRMLRAVIDEVAERGYAATTATRVCSRAAVSSRSFYEQFDNLQDCFLTAYDLEVDAFIAGIAGEIEREGKAASRIARFARLLRPYLDAIAADPAFARAALVEIYAVGPDALARRERTQARFIALAEQMLWARPGADQLNPRDHFSAEALIAAITYLVTARVSMHRYREIPQLAEPILDLARRLSR